MPSLEDLSHQIIEFYEKISSWELAVVKGSGLSPAQMHTIEIVGHAKPLRMKELAQKMGVTTGTLTVMVDRLEQNGLLERRPHESDRRSFLIDLTDKGREFFKEHHQFHLQLTKELTSTLTSDEQKQFSHILEKIMAQI